LPETARLSEHLGGRSGEPPRVCLFFRGESEVVLELPGIAFGFRK
jgi:hypothetical protein